MSDSKELITIIRPSFMKFCQDGCKAAAFNHLLYWIARKGKGEPREKIQDGQVMWYATTEEITEGMSNAWGVCKVRKEVNEIIDMGIIGRGKNPKWGADRTKHFFFGPDQCAELLSLFQKHAICLYCLGLPNDVTQMINLSNANNKIMICKCEKHQMEMINLSDAIDKSIEAITKVSSKVTAKDSIKESSTALRANNDSPVAEKVKEPFTEREQQIIKWFCEVSGMTSVNMTRKAAQESMIAILPEIESIDDMRGLYEQAKNDIAARSDAKNKTVYLANLKDALFNWKQNKPVVQPTIPEMPELTEEELDEKVLWTSSPSAARRLFADGATMREHMEDRYCKPRWMSRRDAREYDYDMPEVQHYTLDQQAEYRQLAGRQELAIAG